MGSLLVYLHVAVKQRAFQSLLGTGLPGVVTTAVGRVADFERALQDARYAIVGAGAPPEAAKVASVGALDLLGRDGTNRFVRRLVGQQVRVERVTKIEDLLPLLQMQRVDAVLLPARLVADMRSASRLPLAERQLDQTVALPAVANTGPGGAAVLGAISRMPKDISKLLGVEEWR